MNTPDPIFQVGGNLGATAAIIEMLVQSHDGDLRLLPALPQEWESGELKGVHARGKMKIDVSWRKGTLVSAVLYPERDQTCRIIIPPCSPGKQYRLSGRLLPDQPIQLKAGAIYRIS